MGAICATKSRCSISGKICTSTSDGMPIETKADNNKNTHTHTRYTPLQRSVSIVFKDVVS